MATLIIKNVPEELYTRLKQSAERNRRSLDAEVLSCVERVINGQRIRPEEHIERARLLRQKTENHPITDEEFNAAKRAGRA